MPFDRNIHHRRSIRLPTYDYRLPGAYFVTIVTHDRQPIFGQVHNDQMYPNDLGRIVEECWHSISAHHPGWEIDAFVIMPNHVHGILLATREQQHIVGAQRAAPLRGLVNGTTPIGIPPGSLGAVVRSFKAVATKTINESLTQPCKVWQRNYFERVLRDRELEQARQYVVNNPANWSEDKYSPLTLH